MKWKPLEGLTFLHKRGGLYFYGKDNLIHVYLGPYDYPESEHIFTTDISFVSDLIAGLTAIKHRKD